MIGYNPAASATAPTVPFKKMRGYTPTEISKLMAVAAASGNPQDVCIIALLLTTWMRRSELLGLTWDAIDLETGELSVLRTVVEVEQTDGPPSP